MNSNITIAPLTQEKFSEAVELVLKADLDTKEEIEDHLKELDAHYVALDCDKVVGIIGWYQDTKDYAKEALGDKFPGPQAYWVGFFVVDKDYRGKGIGVSLMQHLENILQNKSIDKLWVSTSTAREYYERQGFAFFANGYIKEKLKHFLTKNL